MGLLGGLSKKKPKNLEFSETQPPLPSPPPLRGSSEPVLSKSIGGTSGSTDNKGFPKAPPPPPPPKSAGASPSLSKSGTPLPMPPASPNMNKDVTIPSLNHESKPLPMPPSGSQAIKHDLPISNPPGMSHPPGSIHPAMKSTMPPIIHPMNHPSTTGLSYSPQNMHDPGLHPTEMPGSRLASQGGHPNLPPLPMHNPMPASGKMTQSSINHPAPSLHSYPGQPSNPAAHPAPMHSRQSPVSNMQMPAAHLLPGHQNSQDPFQDDLHLKPFKLDELKPFGQEKRSSGGPGFIPHSHVPGELPAFPAHHDHSYPVPNPNAPQAGARLIKRTVEKKRLPEIDIPTPPPNLRSEISPLELEKLEEKYLNKHPRVIDVEKPFKYNRHANPMKPIFVRTDDYRQVLDYFIDIKDTINEAEEIFYRLQNLKKNDDLELVSYKNTIEDIQRKLIFVDKTIYEQ